MDDSGRLHDQMRDIARQEARRVSAVTDWGVVTVTAPLTVRVAGDDTGQEFPAVTGVAPAVGDTVGLVRFGRRWYVTTILETP